jgi:hypothetical protein
MSANATAETRSGLAIRIEQAQAGIREAETLRRRIVSDTDLRPMLADALVRVQRVGGAAELAFWSRLAQVLRVSA